MVQRITIAPQGPEFSRFVMGYWRLMDWNMSALRWIKSQAMSRWCRAPPVALP